LIEKSAAYPRFFIFELWRGRVACDRDNRAIGGKAMSFVQSFTRSLIGSACALVASAAFAQYPNKPVKIVVHFPAGGTTDILARAIGAELQKSLGQPFVIENRAGAGGNIGSDAVAKAPADGYTLLMGTVGTHAINVTLYPKMPYDAVKDFAPVSLVAGVPNVLIAAPSFPANSVN
jgi:tripartite-type tricarboxylate transporter receptor subunit TctC